MENGLVQTSFEISTPFHTYPSIFIAPVWAQSFECFKEHCGLCCLTEKPNDISGVNNANLDKQICKLYNIKAKLCNKYGGRPDMCKSYPFFLGVEEGKIIASLDLECPGSNGKTSVPKTILENTFKSSSWNKRITFLNDCYEQAVLSPFLWFNAERDRYNIIKWIEEFYRKESFPYISEIRETIFRKLTGHTGEIPPIQISNIIERLIGAYIATRFESFNLGLFQAKGTKLKMLLFDENLVELKKTVFLYPRDFGNLEMEKSAYRLFRDYISLLLHRPYLSLATTLSISNGEQVGSNFFSSLCGVLGLVETSANIIALRDNLTTIDRETMREIISFCEGSILSTFIRPDIAKRF
jgi:hypothetical protein